MPALLAALVLAVLGSQYASIHKSLAAQREAIDGVWAQVDAALENRAELIAGLVETMEREAPDQTAKIGAVKDARAALSGAHGPRDKIQANGQLDYALGNLLLLAENYPSLESGKKYGDLLEALKSAEFQIAVARRKYNEAVEHYNTRIALFPDNLVASLSRLGKVDAYFQTPAL